MILLGYYLYFFNIIILYDLFIYERTGRFIAERKMVVGDLLIFLYDVAGRFIAERKTNPFSG